MNVRRAIGVTCGALWVVAMGAGFTALVNYSNRAGDTDAAPRQWPGASRIPRNADHAMLVLFFHPRCPCSSASLGELARLKAHCQRKVAVQALFVVPPEESSLIRAACAIPGVNVLHDEHGVEARRFGAKTSGQALLYDRYGKLLFSGGITAARGHWGDNAGSAAIVAAVHGAQISRAATPVFGCPLFDPESKCKNGSGS